MAAGQAGERFQENRLNEGPQRTASAGEQVNYYLVFPA
jgi:hypothetical protein